MQCSKRAKDKKTKLSREGKFDAYVCYDFQGNNDFVTDTILLALEENHDPPMTLCIHKRDFEPGLQIIDNIRLAIKNSKPHPAGTSKESDKCDLSKNSEIAPLTLGSVDKSFFLPLILCHTGNLFE